MLKPSDLVNLLQETSEGLTGRELPPFEGEPQWTDEVSPMSIRERLRRGHLIHDEETGAELAETFLNLSEEDQERLWANVKAESDYENYLAGGPDIEPVKREKRPPVFLSPDSSSRRLSLGEALQRLGRVRGRGDRWFALCPAHEDKSPSLVVEESERFPGEPWFHCYAGCDSRVIREKLIAMRGDG